MRGLNGILPSFFVLLFLSFVGAGCASQHGTLLVKPESKTVAYTQAFAECVHARTAEGTDEFVLVSDNPPDGSQVKPLHQVLYLKVLWRPMNGAERNVAANASLVWYVTSDPNDRLGDLLEYHGSAHATVVNKGNITKVILRDGTIKPESLRGGLSDPCGPSQVEGSFVAVNNPQKLREILNSSRLRLASASE